MGFKLKTADEATVEIKDGEYYFNTKARARRMCLNSLSSDARRVYACLELATMGWQQELAVIMEAGEKRPLTPNDICQQTGLSKQNARRGIAELEEQGLAERRGVNGGPLHKGKVSIYSWAVPRPPKIQNGSHARLPFPEWFPDSWAPLKPLISRYKYILPADEVVARDYFEEGEVVARAQKQTEEVVTRFLERLCAPPQSAVASLCIERTEITLRERTSSSSAVVPKVQASRPPRENRNCGASNAEEEELSLYQKFKAQYPADHYDEAKAKPFFDGKTPTQQAHVLERLALYLSCERWRDDGGRWIPLASNWLQTYEADPPPLMKKKAAAAPAKKGYVESLREEAERRIAKYGRI